MTKGLLISRNIQKTYFLKKLVMQLRLKTNTKNSEMFIRPSWDWAKKQYFENGFRKYKPNPKTIWELLNEITSRNRNRETISEIKIGQNQSTNSTNIANHFNGFFFIQK